MLVALITVGCDNKSVVDETNNTPVVRPAKLLKVGQSSIKELMSFPAVIQAQQSSELAFQVGGVIVKMAVIEGQAVEQDQGLAQIDSRDYVAKLDVAKAQYENANAEYKRALALVSSNLISKSELAKRKADNEVTKSQLTTAKKSLDDTTLHAPFSGRIAKILSEKDESISAGKQVFMLLSLNQLEAKIDMPSRVIVHSRESDKRGLTAYVVLDAAPEYQIKATFKEVALEADRESQTYEVIFGFDSLEQLTILPGMSATVFVKEKNPDYSPQVMVPLSSIGSEGDLTFVWLVDTNTMAVTKRTVVLKPGIGEEFKVLNGLELGDTIVVAGISTLIEGAIVRPWIK